MSRIIITGGSGLIGRALTERLVGDGHEVIILSRQPAQVTGLPAGATAEKWDGRSPDGWGHLVDGAQAIVNLAGVNIAGDGFFPTRWTDERRRLIRRSRVEPGQAVTAAIEMAANRPAVVIQASAIGYYGADPDKQFDESAPPGDDFAAQVCFEWEQATAGVIDLGVRQVIIRSGLVFAMEGGSLPRIVLPFRLFAGGPFGNGRQWVSWIHMDDEVAAIRQLIVDENAAGPYNLTAPNPVRYQELARGLGRVMRRPSFIPVPSFVLRALFGEVANVVLEGQQVLPAKLQAAGFTFRFPRLEPALRDLFDDR